MNTDNNPTRKLAQEILISINASDEDLGIDEVTVLEGGNEPLLEVEEASRELLLAVKVAVVRAEDAINHYNIPPDIAWSALLNGLAQRCNGYIEVARLLLSFESKEQVVSWYLSANYSSQDIFKWLEAGGLSDDEIVFAFTVSDPWRGTEYNSLSDEELIGYILASGWQQPRQMATMIYNNVITKNNIHFLAKLNGSKWILEMIARGGIFNESGLMAVQALNTIDKSDPRKKVPQWNKFKIYQYWKELGISDKVITNLFYQAMGDEGLTGLVEFLRSLPKAEDDCIICNLLDLGLSMERIALAYAPVNTTNNKADNRLLHPQFIGALEKLGKSNNEIVAILIDCEFTLYMIANNLTKIGWDPEVVLISMIESGCDVLLISKMLDEAAQDPEKNTFWRPEVIRYWKKLIKNSVSTIATQQIFGVIEINQE